MSEILLTQQAAPPAPGATQAYLYLSTAGIPAYEGATGGEILLVGSANPSVPHTITAPGTAGAQTINKPAGRVNIAAAGTSIVVTNSLVTADSHVFAVVASNDSTAKIKNVVPGAGSFTVTMEAAVTAETKIDFFVVNGF